MGRGGNGIWRFHSDMSDFDVVCVFVVAFDTRAGNIVEWSLPDEVDLDGIEFKAMTSGSHRIKYDFAYFKKDRFYGISCFENMPVDSEIERGARMKSVGVLATSYKHLHRYKRFLEAQVSSLLACPGDYTKLKEFFEKTKGILLNLNEVDQIRRLTDDCLPTDSLQITHPAGCFSQFIRFFGEQIFLLWKFSLLKKRILFFSPPPIGVVCYRVYCTNCLTVNNNHPELRNPGTNMQFYVNLTDISVLESEDHYIACTSEKIFETKTHLYDIYVDNQNVTTKVPHLQKMLKLTATDKANFRRLCSRIGQQAIDYTDNPSDESDVFLSFFSELNNRLFEILFDVSSSGQKELTDRHFKALDLDPSGDQDFLKELIEIYGIDVELSEDGRCCPI